MLTKPAVRRTFSEIDTSVPKRNALRSTDAAHPDVVGANAQVPSGIHELPEAAGTNARPQAWRHHLRHKARMRREMPHRCRQWSGVLRIVPLTPVVAHLLLVLPFSISGFVSTNPETLSSI